MWQAAVISVVGVASLAAVARIRDLTIKNQRLRKGKPEEKDGEVILETPYRFDYRVVRGDDEDPDPRQYELVSSHKKAEKLGRRWREVYPYEKVRVQRANHDGYGWEDMYISEPVFRGVAGGEGQGDRSEDELKERVLALLGGLHEKMNDLEEMMLQNMVGNDPTYEESQQEDQARPGDGVVHRAW